MISDLHPFIANEVKKLVPLTVGQIVLAIHPICKHFHRGSILTIEGSTVMIKFFGNDLGSHKVEDANISILSGRFLSQLACLRGMTL